MNDSRSSWCLGVLMAISVSTAQAGPLSRLERERLLAHLEMTGSWLRDEVAKLSEPQLRYRPAPEQWTVAEVVQHLVIAEPNYWKLLQDGVQRSPVELKQKATDADVLWYGIDRTRHDKTSASQDPKGQKVRIAEALTRFQELHAKMIEYAKTTQDDLRGHTVPEWGVDAYQCLLEISTHEQRHILQIREIKSSTGFPKK
jgi:hypothetical protein